MVNTLLNFCLRWRWPVVLLSLILVILAALGVPRIAVLSDYKAFVDPEYPALLRLDEIEAIFSENHNLLIAIAPKDEVVFKPKTLALVQRVTDDAWLLPHTSRVDSVTNFQHTEARGDDLFVGDLVPTDDPISNALSTKASRVAANEPSLNGVLVSEKQHVAVVSITFEIPDDLGSAAAHEQIIDAVNDMVDQYKADHPDTHFEVTGMVTVNHALGKYAIQDSTTLIPGMLLVMGLILGFVTRSGAAIVATGAVVLFTVIGTMGMLGWWGWVIDSCSAISPVVIMTLAVADSIHIIEGMQIAMARGMAKMDALRLSLRDNLAPVFLTSLTTVLGVMTFAFSTFPSLRRIGISVAIGVAVAFILSVTLLPALLSMMPMKARPARAQSRFLSAIPGFVFRNPKKIVLVAILICGSLLPLIPMNAFNDAPNAMLSAFTPERKAVEFFEENVSGILRVDVAVFSNEPGGVNNPDFLRTVDNFAQWLRGQPEIDRVNSLTDTFKRLNKNMHGDDPDWYRLPEQQDLAAQYLLLYEMSLPYGLALNNQLDIDQSAVRLTAIYNEGDSQKIWEGKAKIEDWFAANAPALNVEVTGTIPLMAELSYIHFIPSMVKGGSIAVLMVSLVLFFALRSWKLGFLGMLANILPIASGYGLWYLMNGKVSFAVASVAGVCLGVVVDFAVHFLSKYQRGRREGKDTESAIEFAFGKTARPLRTTLIVLVAGFWLLMLSPVSFNADMGRLTGIILIGALAFDFLVLPALLVLMARPALETQRVNAPSPS
ncbi:MAG: RND transporter [Porticoccaceae bacterium]|nr:RND transporter [Porticoccaceae bacterium]